MYFIQFYMKFAYFFAGILFGMIIINFHFQMNFPNSIPPLQSLISTIKRHDEDLIKLQSKENLPHSLHSIIKTQHEEKKSLDESTKIDTRPMIIFRDFFNLNETDTSDQTTINPYIYQILAPLNPVEMYVINLGANDGKSLDPVYSLFSNGASGLAVELNQELFNALNINLPWNRVKKLSQHVSPLSIVNMLLMAGSPKVPDVFKIDIDSYDISVVDALLQNGTFTPRLILMEINEKIPPPIQFAINQYEPFAWKADHCFGISIEKVARILLQHDYIPVALDWNNLYSIPRSTLNNMPKSTYFKLDYSTQSLYDLGYWKRQGRSQIFPYNSNVDIWANEANDPGKVMRDIFSHMINTASFRDSSLTFELSLPTGIFII